MKTAISIPDPIFAEGEQFAHQMGLSRSELYARALQQYLQNHRYQGVTAALNALYAEEPSTLDPVLAAAQTKAIAKEEW